MKYWVILGLLILLRKYVRTEVKNQYIFNTGMEDTILVPGSSLHYDGYYLFNEIYI